MFQPLNQRPGGGGRYGSNHIEKPHRNPAGGEGDGDQPAALTAHRHKMFKLLLITEHLWSGGFEDAVFAGRMI
ncbi:Uncharacterised protein [Shigella sonnei]|nr:Uncharacterised protein [Shigella sonnei]